MIDPQQAILSTNGPANPVEVFFMVNRAENQDVTKLEHVVVNLNIQIQRQLVAFPERQIVGNDMICP